MGDLVISSSGDLIIWRLSHLAIESCGDLVIELPFDRAVSANSCGVLDHRLYDQPTK
jgi:hypothetical protein